jgi:Domain of unknown function (DUF4345)
MILFLRIMAITILLAGSAHLLLGVGAEALLGANLSAQTLAEPSLNSQNRFYGTSYMLNGILLWVCTRDMERYAVIFRILLIMTFAAGLTRILSLMLHGWPSPTIIALAVSELLLPPFVFWWQQRSRGLS